MRVSLTKQQALVAKVAPRQREFRLPYMECVRIGGGKVAATDGFMLAQTPVDYDGEPVFVPARMIPSGPCDVEVEGESVRVITAEGTAEIEHVWYDYPNTERAWADDTKRNPRAYVALNAALLRKMLACIEGKDGSSPNGMVRLYIRRPEDAVEWRVQNPEGGVLIEGLIEPMYTWWGQSDERISVEL
jgi:hypothetical protein